MYDNLIVISMREKAPDDFEVINTTTRDKDWYGKELSPFHLTNISLYNGLISKNMENAWQYSKVYSQHVDSDNNPTQDYFDWAQQGWNASRAERYPMGKGSKPLYSFWNGRKLEYIEARKQIYFPLYARAVVKTNAFKEIKARVIAGDKIALLDFDGYNHLNLNMNFYDVINSESKRAGHAFVIYGLIQRELALYNNYLYIKSIG